MVDIYKTRLKLDTMVVNTYNAILALKPSEMRALDALATQYEHMKRWPDLIGVLQKKAAAVGDAATGGESPVELYLRIAGLFQEKFSNVAEAIKAYEKVLELDGGNATAIAYLKTNYEKRRDWEKLIGVHQKEIERIADPNERSAKFIEVAKLASEKLKKPSVSIELWQKVLDSNPAHLEALGELEKLYEREKIWDKLADVMETQARLIDDRTKKVAALQKLGILFTDKVNEPTRATAAWRALLDVEPENKRGQDALKKLYLQQKNFDELEKFYAAQNKYDEYIRVLERQAETEDDATKIVLNVKIAELYRDRLAKPDRAMRAYEKVLSLDAQNLKAAEALIPLYEGAKDPRKLVSVLEIQLGHTTALHDRVERMRRLAELSEDALKDKAAAYGWQLKLFGEDPTATGATEHIERLAKESGGWAELVGAYEAAYGKLGDRKLPLMLVVARVQEEGARRSRQGAGDEHRDPQARREQRAGDRGARAALLAHRALQRAARHLREEAQARERQGSAKRDPLQSGVDLRARDQGQRAGDLGLSGHPQGLCRRAAGVPRARSHLRRDREVERAVAGHSARAGPGAAGRRRGHRRSEVPLGAAARAAPERLQGRDRHVSRHPRHRRHACRRAGGAREAADRRAASAHGGGDLGADLRAHRRVGAAHRRARDSAAARDGAVAEDASVAAHRRAARRQSGQRRQGVRRLCARVP
jgi:tetratricopeptide (TPR) repeat protein